MNRFLSILLIVMILTCQGLSAVHAHFGMELGHSASHSGRPHFHVHGSHSHGSHEDSGHHHHDDAPVLPGVSRVQFPLHDSDACYCADSVTSMIRRSGAAETLEITLLELTIYAIEDVQFSALFVLDGWPCEPCQWSTARTPLYLRDLSIRC